MLIFFKEPEDSVVNKKNKKQYKDYEKEFDEIASVPNSRFTKLSD